MPLAACASFSAAALVPASRRTVVTRRFGRTRSAAAAARRGPIAMAADAPTYHLLTLQYGALYIHQLMRAIDPARLPAAARECFFLVVEELILRCSNRASCTE